VLIGGYQIWVPGAPRYELPAFDPDSNDTNSVIWLCKPHPTNPFSGTVAVEAGSMSLDQDWYARLYNRNFLMNDGRPGGLLTVKGLGDEGVDVLQQRFSGGPSQAGRTSVIEAEDASWLDTAISPRDAQYQQLRTITKEEILEGIHGVPDTILGMAANRTYDNADAEREVYWTETMNPHLWIQERALEVLTSGGIHDDVRLWHDVSNIEVLNRAYEKRVSGAMDQFNAGLITIDEFRKLTGREPFNVPGSRVVFVAGSKAPIGDEGDTKAAQKLTVLPISSSQQASQNNQAAAASAAPPSGQPASASPGAPAAAARGGLSLIAGGRKVFSNPPDSTGAMVALGLDDESVAALTPYTDDPKVLHLTIAYLGKADAYSIEQREQVLDAVDRALDGVTSFTGTIATVTTFPVGPDGVPVIALVDAPELRHLRTGVIKALTAIGVEQQSAHAFNPHVTLRYLPEGAPLPEGVTALSGSEITFSTVILTFGPQVDERPLDEQDVEIKAADGWA